MKKFLLVFGLILFAPATHAATLSLSPGSGDIITGCAQILNIVVDTEGANSLATDAFLTYNPDEIEILDQDGALGGIQLTTSNAYETYPGNQVNNGVIRLTGFNRSGFFNGRAVLGKIRFQGKPGVQASTIRFQFTPGSSTDSNVANAESQDVLRAATGATFTFREGSCPVATPPPKPTETTPEKQETEIDRLRGELEECQDALTVLENYYKNGHTTEERNEILCQGITVRPAAPPGASGAGSLFWWILLALSLLLNIDMLMRPENHVVTYLPFFGKKGKHIKTNFRKRKIKNS